MARGRRQEAEKVDKTAKRWKINPCSTWTAVSRSIIRANTLDAYTSFGTRGPSVGGVESSKSTERGEALEKPRVASLESSPEGGYDSARRRAHYFKGGEFSRRSGHFITCLWRLQNLSPVYGQG